MNRIFSFFVIILLFSFCKVASADVIINEIAWMGTNISTNDEWIELYNDGAATTLDGWTLVAADGSPSINLTGTISATGYYLAERTDDSTVPNITAGVIYSGSLSNTGETLMLINNSGQTVDTVNMASGWTAGNSSTHETMQRNNNAWVTGTATAGVQNTLGSSIPVDEESDEETETTTITPQKALSEKQQWQKFVETFDPEARYSTQIIIPDSITARVPFKINAEVKRFNIITDMTGKYEWSLGDGKSYLFYKNQPVEYTYQQPGQYVVILKYYSNLITETPDSVQKKVITVIPASVTVSGASDDGSIKFTNTSGGDLDLQNWSLTNGLQTFQFVTSTLLQKDSSMVIPFTVHHITNVNAIKLLTPTGYNASTRISNVSFDTTPPITTETTLEPESLLESPQTASVVPLENKKTSFPIWWIIGFIALAGLGSVGFHFISRLGYKIDEKPENA